MGFLERLMSSRSKDAAPAYEPMPSALIEERKREQEQRLTRIKINKEVFADTLRRIESDNRLQNLTAAAAEGTYIVGENFKSDSSERFRYSRISYEENLTLITAERYAGFRKTGVLNFANPVEPGGGVLRGADAQEEYLCRASNLYRCLTGHNAAPYYEDNERRRNYRHDPRIFLASDKIVYSPGVTVFRKDTGYVPYDDMRNIGATTQEYTDNWFSVDVLTCAAPILFEEKTTLPEGLIRGVFCKRIRNIFEAAMDNDIEVLVLGAFGCGSFHNPPQTVAEAFSEVLSEDRYKNAFSDVVFSVKRTSWDCDNTDAFEKAFGQTGP